MTPPLFDRGDTATHNLSGQRLGPKGLITRERIIQAMMRLLDGGDPAPITLSAIAREAQVGMSTLYLYFPDMVDLLLAVMRRVICDQEALFVERIGTVWPDATLRACCHTFVAAHFQFWKRHARLLNLRNQLADTQDPRMVEHRQSAIAPVITKMAEQMDTRPGPPEQAYLDCAVVLYTGLERISHAVINPEFGRMVGLRSAAEQVADIDRLIEAEVNILHLVVRDMRSRTPVKKRSRATAALANTPPAAPVQRSRTRKPAATAPRTER